MTERHELWQLADALQMDIRAAAAKLVALRAHLTQLDLPEPTDVTCPLCGIRTKGPNTLAEHIHVSHEGPLPPTWAHAEAISDEPPAAGGPRGPEELAGREKKGDVT